MLVAGVRIVMTLIIVAFLPSPANGRKILTFLDSRGALVNAKNLVIAF
jgi:hypothetical protein